MSRHTLSHADQLFFGPAQYGRYQNALRGIEMSPLTLVSLGTPAVAATDNILDGVDATDSAQVYTTFDAQPDVPRALQVVGSAGADHVVTITGLDAYGEVIVEQLTLNEDTPVLGKKAFASITQVDVAAGAASDTMDLGTQDLIGLPFRIDKGDFVMAFFDGLPDLSTSAVPGTIAYAVTTDPATATTGDVRGTYNPQGTLNGSKLLQVLLRIDPTSKVTAFGVDQYGG